MFILSFGRLLVINLFFLRVSLTLTFRRKEGEKKKKKNNKFSIDHLDSGC